MLLTVLILSARKREYYGNPQMSKEQILEAINEQVDKRAEGKPEKIGEKRNGGDFGSGSAVEGAEVERGAEGQAMNLKDVPTTPYSHSEIYRTAMADPLLAQEMLRRNLGARPGENLAQSRRRQEQSLPAERKHRA